MQRTTFNSTLQTENLAMIIDALWREQGGKFFFLATKSASGKWQEHCIARADVNNKTIQEFCKTHADKSIYFCPHGFTEPHRQKKFAVLPKMLWADLDGLKCKPHEIIPKPTVCIESSPGRYVGLWLTDRPVSEELNRDLTYSIVGADHGGWDTTQVLRLPNTTNYKYQSLPKVRILWDDGPVYKLAALEKQIPPAEGEKEVNEDIEEIYDRYERSMPSWLRRELRNGKPRPGQRSDMLWKMEHELLNIGCSKTEAFILIQASAWNKFRTRRDGDKQLKNEIRKAARLEHANDDDRQINGYNYLSQSLADIEEEKIDWLWHLRFALGELHIVEGDPEVGKSYFVQMFSKAICDGDRLPGMTKACQGKVAYFDMENSRGSVTKVRMRHNGLQCENNFFQEEEPFSIDNETELLKVDEAIERLKPLLVVFDTINTYTGGADSYKASEATQALRWFREIAKRFHCAVVIIRHLTKGTREKAMYRGQGSMAYVGMARIVHTVGRSPDDPNLRVVAITKVNIAARPQALSFRINAIPTLSEPDGSRFEWGELVNYTSDQIIQPVEKNKDTKDEETVAIAFLKDTLADQEPIDISRVRRMAEKRNISWRILRKISDDGNLLERVRKGREVYWTLK